MPISTKTSGPFALTRPPRNNDELHSLVHALWGVHIPQHKVCAEHVAPFDWFADAFFARTPIAIALGSRGLSGKSYAMAALGLTQAVVLGSDVNLLGGSMAQSQNLHEHMRRSWNSPGAPNYMVTDSTMTAIKFTNGAVIHPLTASQKTVRGPHPARICLDEVDEMDYEILQSALGQPMPQKNWLGVQIPAATSMTSTLQYADGSMAKELRRVKELGLPTYSWCAAVGTKITTERGPVEIQEVLATDRVLTRAGFMPVQHVTYKGRQQVYEVRTGLGPVVRVTGEHKVLTTNRGWVEAALLRSTDSVRIAQADSAASTSVGVHGFLPDPASALVDDDPRFEPVRVDGYSWTVSHVINVTPTDIQDVYDIGVYGAHEFVADGVLIHNCYKDSANPVDGWLTQSFIEQKKLEVSKERWRVEYDLGEPSIGNRAIDTEAVERAFSLSVGRRVKISKDYEEYEMAGYDRTRDYVVSADWARSQDYTVISVWDVTDLPITLAYYVRCNHLPWPVMVGKFNTLQKAYHASAIHDATGLGDVVASYLDSMDVWDFKMTGHERDDMLSEFVLAVEQDRVRAARIDSIYLAHKYASVEDLYSRSKEFHLPDEVCSAALAWKAVSDRFPAVEPFGTPKADNNWMAKAVETNQEKISMHSTWRPEIDTKDLRAQGVVRDETVSHLSSWDSM